MRNFTGVPNNPLGECIYTLYKLCHDKTTSSEFRVLFLSFFFITALANNLKCMSEAFKDFSESKIKAYIWNPFRPPVNTSPHWT